MWGEGTSGALAMDKQGGWFAIHPVFLNLCNVVRDIVDDVHVEVVGRGVEDFCEGLGKTEQKRKCLECIHDSIKSILNICK